MKCPKCGAEIDEGSLYCKVCGEEIFMVPDFEPELEKAYSRNLSNVKQEIRNEIHKDLIASQRSPVKKQNQTAGPKQEPKAEGKSGAKPAPKPGGKPKGAPPKKSGKSDFRKKFAAFWTKERIVLAGIVGGMILVVAVISGIFAYLSYRESDSYRLKKATQEYASGDYRSAITLYEKLHKSSPWNESISLTLLDCYDKCGEDARYQDLLSELAANADTEEKRVSYYSRLIQAKISAGLLEDAVALVKDSGSDALMQQYSSYLAAYLVVPPAFSLAEGTYDVPTLLRISAGGNDKIYYSLDGRDPKQFGKEYKMPILLEEGETDLCAYSVNEMGLESEIVTAKYIVEAQEAEALLEISPESGKYEHAQWITALYDLEGGSLYYTTDGSEPDETSELYTEPIPMQLGITKFRFIFIDEEGKKSEITDCDYELVLHTSLSPAETMVVISNALGQNGTYGYIYHYPIPIEGVGDLYLCTEYFGGDQDRSTGRIYGVDVYTETIYRIENYYGGYRTVEKVYEKTQG